MKYSNFFIPVLILAFTSCKKGNNNTKQSFQDKFSFTYNGLVYNKTVTNNVANAGAYHNNSNTGILIDMPSVFGGQINFLKTECAYLAPPNKVVYVNEPDCQFSEQDDYGNIQPIDSVQTYIYQSGSLNISLINCESHGGTDPVLGLPYSYNTCEASGTFDLTLVNKNNQTIKITNGVVDEMINY